MTAPIEKTPHEALLDPKVVDGEAKAVSKRPTPNAKGQKHRLIYLVLPSIFLTVTLLGGLRLGAADSSFIFLKPALVCLVFAAMTIVLFFRAGLLAVEGWFSDEFSTLQNVANAGVVLTLFASTVQLFNSLLPDQGLPFWVVGFCFFWTIWNNLFAEFNTKKLLRSLMALFGLAFVVKYLVLANLTAPSSEGWLRRIFENPGKEAFTWLLDLPRYAAGTGYLQFFAVMLYMFGLFLMPPSVKK
jgi:hypothetical protein